MKTAILYNNKFVCPFCHQRIDVSKLRTRNNKVIMENTQLECEYIHIRSKSDPKWHHSITDFDYYTEYVFRLVTATPLTLVAERYSNEEM